MKCTSKLSKAAILTSLVVGLISCGTGETSDRETEEALSGNQTDSELSSVASDDELSEESASSAIELALSSAADATAGTSEESDSDGFGLRSGGNLARWERSCSDDNEEGVAIVELNASFSAVRSASRRLFDFERKLQIKDSRTRTWSHESQDMTCDSTKRFAKVDWKSDLTGTKVDVKLSRQVDHTLEITHQRSDRSISTERSHDARGTRSVSWVSHSEDEEAQSVTRTAEITNDVTHVKSRTGKFGRTKTITMNYSTAEDAPLQIASTRNMEGELQSKNVNGTIIATRKGDGRVETAIDGLEVLFENETCEVYNGVITFSFFKEKEEESDREEEGESDKEIAIDVEKAEEDGLSLAEESDAADKESDAEADERDEDAEEEADRILVLTIVDGEYTLVDQKTGREFEDFVLNACNYSDFVRR